MTFATSNSFIMKPKLLYSAILPIISAVFIITCLCCSRSKGNGFSHTEKNSVYYWKTTFAPNNADYAFIRKHNLQRIYIRVFDVSTDTEDQEAHPHTYPNATIQISDSDFEQIQERLPKMGYVPVVYITLEALKDAQKYGIGDLAHKIVHRTKNICSYNGLNNVEGIQLDCDWTQSTEKSFFALCDSVRAELHKFNLPWVISSTIRLHQLTRQAPPVDYGVLMVYNTGNFNDPDANNSILNEKDVAPYLKHLADYPLHLDVAYPTYSWQLLFRNRKFVGLLDGVNVTDTIKFRQRTRNSHIALADIPHRNIVIHKGDVIRTEQSDFATIKRVKSMIDAKLSRKPHSTILYHFELKNLSKYSDNEIEELFNNNSNK